MSSKVPLYGLVLAGGKSTRMNKDKASLEIHGKPQLLYCYELLMKFCDQVFLSNRKDQVPRSDEKGLPEIYDLKEFSGIGPIAGIASALKTHPQNPWLVLACDLPFVNEEVLTKLISQRNPQKLATAYISTHDQLPEPLCAIYEPHSLSSLLNQIQSGKNCPRKFLINSDVELIAQPFAHALNNINTPQELEDAIKIIKKK